MITDTDLPNDVVAKVASSFEAAELIIKKYERISLTACLPAINELRYAGHHIVRGVKESIPAKREEQFYKAARHCERAEYDAQEAMIIYLLKFMENFQEHHYPETTLDKYIPQWRGWRDEFLNSRTFLREIRAIKHLTDPQKASLEKTIQTLVVIRDDIERGYPVIDEVLVKQEEEKRIRREAYEKAEQAAQDKKEDRRYYLAVFLSSLGVIISIFGIIISIYK